ncbi:MAG TPA: LCP family protein [Candidatus Saccharimonadales bacterium]|nr:LCP family protein [Candidatus Saccharimonadales bacterium]
MKHNSKVPNTDGFVIRPRAAGSQPGRPTLDSQRLPDQFLIDPSRVNKKVDTVGDESRSIISAGDVDHKGNLNLNELNIEDSKDAKKGKDKKVKSKRKWPVKKTIKWTLLGLLIIALLIGGYFAYKFFATGSKVFQGNLVNAVFAPPKELKMDQNGRTNVIVFGTSEDDPGHDGADLTDSMMLISADQKKKEAFLVSIPRDLYVEYGRACPAGYRGKINALYSCVYGETGDEAVAQEAVRAKIGEVFGLDVQYAAHINYTVLREAVDAVGGVTVQIDSKDSRGIMDRNFDWDCPNGLYTCYNVKYPNGPANLNGKQALYLARARGASGDTYGLPQANFDREGYQRKILVALLEKAVSAGTLSNPVAVGQLLETLGNNVRTNFDAEEIKTLVKLGQETNPSNILSLVLNNPDGPLVITGNADGQSIVQPAAGLYNYSGFHAAIMAYATGDFASLEKAAIDVLNASEQAGVAQVKANDIKANNLLVNVIGNAPAALNTESIQVYDLSGGKMPGTRKKLESIFGVTVKDGAPAGVTSYADFVVVVGTQPEPAQ